MRITTIFWILVLSLVVGTCEPRTQPAIGEVAGNAPVVPAQATFVPTNPTIPAVTEPGVAESSQLTAEAANCASPEANKLGAAIAGDYAFTSTEQVMTWFCNGAEFEDILVALVTADQTGVSAEDLLAILAAGMTWEEIWQAIGLTE